jgi:hypothetical protein
MSEVRGTGWSLALASPWQASDDGDCVSIAHPNGLGALQISEACKNTVVTDDDLAKFAADHIDAGARAIPITLGDFSGLAIRYGVDGTHWRQWFLRHGAVALLVTYNCAEADRGIEDSVVDRMLGSLRGRSDFG